MSETKQELNEQFYSFEPDSGHIQVEIIGSGTTATKASDVQDSDTQESDVKTTSKDSVFRDLFGIRKYAFQLYQAIHPEDTEVTEEDIGDKDM